MFPSDAAKWVAICYDGLDAFSSEQQSLLQQAGSEYFSEALQAYEKHGEDVKAITGHLKTTLGVKGKALFMPLRVALTGLQHGPELGKVMSLMTPEMITERLEYAKNL